MNNEYRCHMCNLPHNDAGALMYHLKTRACTPPATLKTLRHNVDQLEANIRAETKARADARKQPSETPMLLSIWISGWACGISLSAITVAIAAVITHH